MDLLQQKIGALRAVSKRVSTATSENFAAERWDEGEGAITVACVGVFVLESQIHLLQEGGAELEERFCGRNSVEHDVAQEASVQSVPSFVSDNKVNDDGDANSDSPVDTDKVVLARYVHMRSHMKTLEARDENFDRAAALEEQSQTGKLEGSGFLSKKFTLFGGKAMAGADTVVNNTDSSEDVADESIAENGSSHCVDVKEKEISFDAVATGKNTNEEVELDEKAAVDCSNGRVLDCSKEGLDEALENDGPDTENV